MRIEVFQAAKLIVATWPGAIIKTSSDWHLLFDPDNNVDYLYIVNVPRHGLCMFDLRLDISVQICEILEADRTLYRYFMR